MEILKLKPVFKDYIWGGNRLHDDYGFETGYDKTAEGWMLACHKDGMNTIDGGKYANRELQDVIDEIGLEKIAGRNATKFPYFPVLIKLIDAYDNLSIQVHPDDKYAREIENEFGKTEMWYVLDATDDAKLVYGFKDKITSEDFKKSIEDGTLMDKLNSVNVKKGDLFFIEAGTVHAIGKGALIAEIQQNSNCTYRVYDYGRVGKDGKPRELHVGKAVDVSKTEPATHPVMNYADTNDCTLAECELFKVDKHKVNGEITLKTNDTSFNHILIISGNGKIDGREAKKGDSYFVPAGYGEYKVNGDIEIIVTKI